MHRLVQLATKKWLELRKELGRWRNAYAMLMDENYPIEQQRNWPTCQALFPYAEAALANQPHNAKALRA